MNFRYVFLLTVVAAALSACANTERVLFVTSTQIGIDADSKTQSVSIGYDRYEGYVGPAYENGGLPPVIAHLESNLSVFDPKISQVYATGDAARLAAGRGPKWSEKPLSGKKNITFFGTGTNFGLKATFSSEAPAFNLGYKRQEFSLIPIGSETEKTEPAVKNTTGKLEVPDPKDPDGSEDIYPSVLAAFDLNVANKSYAGTGAGVSQFFATGDAADSLAVHPDIRAAFQKEAREAMNIRDIDCVTGTDDASSKILAWVKLDAKNKNTLKSIVESEFGSNITNWELINCKDYADKRALVLKRHNLAP